MTPGEKQMKSDQWILAVIVGLVAVVALLFTLPWSKWLIGEPGVPVVVESTTAASADEPWAVRVPSGPLPRLEISIDQQRRVVCYLYRAPGGFAAGTALSCVPCNSAMGCQLGRSE